MDNPPIDMTSADRARHRLRAWLERHSTALVAATLILIGAHMLYKGISHL